MTYFSPRFGAAVLSTALAVGVGAMVDGSTATAAGKDSVRLVVGFTSGADVAASARRLARNGAAVRTDDALATLRAGTLSVPRDRQDSTIARLRRDPGVAFVSVDAQAKKLDITPDDPVFGQQTELPQIGIPAAWSTTTGSAVTVAVVDTGVTAVGDLTGAVLTGTNSGYDFVNSDDDPADDDGHGTAVASLIAGRGNNGAGMAGVCWGCRILPVKVLDSLGRGYYSDIAAGITYAADHGAKVINLSLSGTVKDDGILQRAVDHAKSKDALVVAAAGNDASTQRNYPAANYNVVSVGGTDSRNDRFEFFDPGTNDWVGSNYGSDWVDVAAPFCTTALNLPGFSTGTSSDDYTGFCGTSASTPLVSGVAALVKSRFPAANAFSLERALTATTLPLTGGWVRTGQVRAERAVVTVDTTKPTITGATPGYLTRFRGTLTATATGVSDTGGAGVSHAWLYADGKYVGSDYTTPFAVKYNSGTRNGTVRLQWKVFDRAGNWATLDRAVLADNAPPSLRITSAPKNGAKVKGTVTVNATASDAAGISRVELLIGNKVVAKDWAAAYTFKINVAKYPKTMKVQVRAIDKVGNIKSDAVRTWKR